VTTGPAPVSTGLADTSVFIAREEGRRIGELPERLAISVVTLGELELGVLSASDAATRAQRGDTLALARQFDPIPLTEAAMSAWARLVQDCARAGISKTVKLTDALIAATAIDLGLPVVTQDNGFAAMAKAHQPLTVVNV
jgi:predicted nucleic acid-binding protein